MPVRLLLDQVTAFKEFVGGDKSYFIAVQKAHVAFIKWLFIKKNSKRIYTTKQLSQIPGVYNGSVIWQHFIKGKKLFSEIVRK